MLFWKLVRVSMRSQLQYPASFLMLVVAHFVGTFADILGIWVLFDRFQMVKGWTLYEVGLVYGVVQMGFAVAESFARGFDTFSQMVRKGDFDLVLLRPISPLLQMATKEVQLMRVGRFLQGLTVLLWSGGHLVLRPVDGVVIVLSILGTASLFYGLLVIQATISFWTVETLEVMNITTYGGMQAGQWPMTLYQAPFRFVFTFLIPIACVAYYPVAILVGQEPFPLWLGLVAPGAGFGFLLLACGLWKVGVRHYCSTGS